MVPSLFFHLLPLSALSRYLIPPSSAQSTHAHSPAGKSTLLRILAGKRLTRARNCRIHGRDVFMAPPQGVVYLGTEWSANPVVRGDIVVSEFLDSVGGYRHKERRDRLLRILDVDLEW